MNKKDIGLFPCVYLLISRTPSLIFNYDLPDMSFIKIGCTRSNVNSRLASANSKYKTIFELMAVVTIDESHIFNIESRIKKRFREDLGANSEFVLIQNDDICKSMKIFMEEICAAG